MGKMEEEDEEEEKDGVLWQKPILPSSFLFKLK